MDMQVAADASGSADEPWTLPQGWCWTNLSVCLEDVARADPAKLFGDEDFSYIDLSAVRHGEISSPQLLKGTAAPSRARQLVQSGDTLYSCVRVYLRNNALVVAGMPRPIASTAFCVLRPNTALNPKFLNYFVETQTFVRRMIPLQRGNSPPSVLDSDVKSQLIALPPLPEQTRIVERIDALFTEIADAEAALEAARKGLGTFRRALLKAAVTGELTRDWRETHKPTETGHDLLARIRAERDATTARGRGKRSAANSPLDTSDLPDLPEGWAWCRPADIESRSKNALAIGPFGSNLKVADYRESGVPLIFVRHIRSENFAADNPKFVTCEKAAELRSHTARAGDILITKMGDPPGDASRYPQNAPDAIITADCIKWTLNEQITFADFFVHFINSPIGKAQILEKTTGVAQQKVSLDRFRQIVVPVPPPAEAAEIVRRVAVGMSARSEALQILDKQAADAARLRQSILKSAFEGKLVQQDPMDEPAAAMLERLRTKNDVTAPRQRGRKKRGL